jgi:hypothetical protein
LLKELASDQILKNVVFLNFDSINSNSMNSKNYAYCIYYDNPEAKVIDTVNHHVEKNLFVLLPNEENLLTTYYKLESKKFEYNSNSLQKVQEKIETLINSKFDLNQLSKEAYKDFLNAYSFSPLNSFRNANNLEHNRICFQFGHSVPLFFSLKEKV